MAFMRLSTAERDEMQRIIMYELVAGVIRAESVAYFQRVVQRMKSDGCDALLLSCKEVHRAV
jgi:aspartate racemase